MRPIRRQNKLKKQNQNSSKEQQKRNSARTRPNLIVIPFWLFQKQQT